MIYNIKMNLARTSLAKVFFVFLYAFSLIAFLGIYGIAKINAQSDDLSGNTYYNENFTSENRQTDSSGANQSGNDYYNDNFTSENVTGINPRTGEPTSRSSEVIGPPLPPATQGITGTPSDIGRTGITGAPSDVGKIVNPLGDKNSTIMEFIQNILIGAIKVSMPIIALAIIYCGFLFVTAQGNSEKVQKAKDALLYTVIGAAILLGSWAIAMLISETVISLY